MHPGAAARYLHMQVPVVNDFVDYLDKKRDQNGVVPNLYEDLFKCTMEGKGNVFIGIHAYPAYLSPFTCPKHLEKEKVILKMTFPWSCEK